MKKLTVGAFLFCAALTMALADHYATKADYCAGKLTPSETTKRRGIDECNSLPPGFCPAFIGGLDIDGDTSGAPSNVDAIPLSCNGNYTDVAGPDHIYVLDASNSNLTTVSLTTADDDYDPSIYMLGACGDGDSCAEGSDSCFAVNAGGNPCTDQSSESFQTKVVQGTSYFLYVDSFYAPGNPNGRDSGPYTLTVHGPCPVELLHFSVE